MSDITEEPSEDISFDDLFVEWLGWFDEAMPDADAASFNTKFEEESYEFLAEKDRTSKLVEFVDTFATGLAWLDKVGFELSDFKEALINKLAINKQRTWELQADGTYHHV